MYLNEMDPKELISSNYFEYYKKETNALVWQIIQLNYNLLFLERIVKFPFKILTINPWPFWHLMKADLFETSIMIIWRLVDTNKKTLTLLSIKNKIKNELITKEYHEQFIRELKKTKFDTHVDLLRTRVEKIRHNRLAHFNRKWIVKPTPNQIKQSKFPLSTLNKSRNSLISLFQFLCFGAPWILFYSENNSRVKHPFGLGECNDIEKLLDTIAKESYGLNLPENNKSQWLLHKKKMSRKDIEMFNDYRKKFNLPGV